MLHCYVCTILFQLIGCAVCDNGLCFLNLISDRCDVSFRVFILSAVQRYGHYYCMIRPGFHLPATTTYQYHIPNMSQTRIASHFAVKMRKKKLPEAFCTFTSSTQISRGQLFSWDNLCGSHDRFERFHLGGQLVARDTKEMTTDFIVIVMIGVLLKSFMS